MLKNKQQTCLKTNNNKHVLKQHNKHVSKQTTNMFQNKLQISFKTNKKMF